MTRLDCKGSVQLSRTSGFAESASNTILGLEPVGTQSGRYPCRIPSVSQLLFSTLKFLVFPVLRASQLSWQDAFPGSLTRLVLALERQTRWLTDQYQHLAAVQLPRLTALRHLAILDDPDFGEACQAIAMAVGRLPRLRSLHLVTRPPRILLCAVCEANLSTCVLRSVTQPLTYWHLTPQPPCR